VRFSLEEEAVVLAESVETAQEPLKLFLPMEAAEAAELFLSPSL
jgi:hypothetical protein